MNKIFKPLGLIFSVLYIVLFNTILVTAFAVGVSGNLNMYPGQTLDIGYDIMNTVGGNGDITVEGMFLEGEDIVSFTSGNKFNVASGAVVPVPVRYEIPADASVGSVYNVRVMFKTISDGKGSGTISFAQDVVETVKINVVERSKVDVENVTIPDTGQKKGVGTSIFLWILIILIIIIVIYFIIKRRKAA